MPEFVIERPKIEQYLLDPHHPAGGPKCHLFLHYGFRRDSPDELARALIRHAEAHRATSRLQIKPISVKRILEGDLDTPSGRRPHAIAVWQIVSAMRERLITAYIREV